MMAPKKDKPSKGNGKGNDSVTNSAFLVKIVDGVAEVETLPYDEPNPDGAILYKTSEDAVKAISEAAVAVFDDPRVQRALLQNAKENSRGPVRSGEPFVTRKIVLDDLLDRKPKAAKPGKPVNGDEGSPTEHEQPAQF